MKTASQKKRVRMKPLSRLLVLFYDGRWEHVRLGDTRDVSYVPLHEGYGLVVSVRLEPQATVPCSENVVRAVESYVRQGVLLQCLQFVNNFVRLVGIYLQKHHVPIHSRITKKATGTKALLAFMNLK